MTTVSAAAALREPQARAERATPETLEAHSPREQPGSVGLLGLPEWRATPAAAVERGLPMRLAVLALVELRARGDAEGIVHC